EGIVTVADIAGIIRIAPGVEIDVAPKFLGEAKGWREDFFVLAHLVRTGRLLPREHIGAAHGARDDLTTLVARAMIDMFWTNHSRPLRKYRRRTWEELSIEGEVDAESVILPSPEGFHKEQLILARANEYNGTIKAAALSILPEVRHSDTRRQLQRV